jgi:predicted transcriptional regulator
VLHCTRRVTHRVRTMTEATFTFRVEEELKQSFTTAAKARDRTGAQLLRDFMRDFVQTQQDAADHAEWFRRQVQAGLDSANAGNLVAAEDVEAEFAKRREQTLQRLHAKP